MPWWLDRLEMDERAMIDFQALSLPMTLAVYFLGGIVLGYTYFRAVREMVNLIVSHGHPLLGLALTLGRMALLGAVFYVAALAGALALLATLAGVLSAKTLMLRQTQSARS